MIPRCEPSSSSTPHLRSLHLHFGAGKLGLGLLLEAIEASNCMDYAIVQRPSSSWKELIKHDVKRIRVKVNGEIVGKDMRFLHGKDVTKAKAGQGPFFIASTGKALLEVVRRATSFSCSLNKGLDGIKVILGRLPKRNNPPKLYACENDHAAVEDIARELDGRVTVIPCMVDRICSQRVINSNGTIEIKTEPWKGQIVVLPPLLEKGEIEAPVTRIDRVSSIETTTESEESDSRKDPNLTSDTETFTSDFEWEESNAAKHVFPFGGPTIVTTSTSDQAEYYARRKILLVNGTHTTLAFLTLIRFSKEHGMSFENMDLPGSFKLLDYAQADAETQRIVWAWLVARCYIISKEFHIDTLKSAHNTTSEKDAYDALMDYAWTTLQRFSHVPDTTGRVLSGGVVKRYDGRLKNVLDVLSGLESKVMTSSTVLAAASRGNADRPTLTLEFMYEAVKSLVTEALPIRTEKVKRNQNGRRGGGISLVTPTKEQHKWNFLTSIRKALFGVRTVKTRESI
eukprot:CAMPEP_0185253216 /NCGR_PEP_ID=MMETSP1359-20130426/2059_1 /TAXON_ID=552665 /ORGANISM="Bigelowiella longifila, Strain CCMP242" /LENGTH=510 /DNA_ID=CAMNT_0027835559 /DNA_START=40 /DNA_END=1572 /DNA_ORIENTATION=-